MAAASGGQAAQSAADFIRQVTTQFSRGQTGRLWDTPSSRRPGRRQSRALHGVPEQLRLRPEKFKILETYADTVDVAGKATPSTAVSVRVTSDDGVTTATMHAVKFNGTWRWILVAGRLRRLQAGQVPVLLAFGLRWTP